MAVDMFLKLDGIDGESTDHKHKGEIELLSFSWGLSNKIASGGGGSTGKPTVSDFSIVKVMDTSSPKLMEGCCSGQHFQTGQITFVNRTGDGKPVEYMKIKLSDILVSSYQAGGSNNGGVVPMDQVSFNFANVDIFAADKSGRFVEVSCNFQKGTDQIGHHHD